MNKIKAFFTKVLSLGFHPELEEGKKFALQVSTLDAYWSIIAFTFYSIYTYAHEQYPLFYFHVLNLFLMFCSLLLIRNRFYDLGRILIHQAGLLGIFICADAFGNDSGFEYYYFTSVIMPHLSFSLKEIWKGIILSAITCTVFVTQQIIGTGLLVNKLVAPPEEKLIAIVFVLLFTLTVLTVARWRLWHAQKEILRQQNDLIHSSNLLALGEMAAGIAHEINNPLQVLGLQLTVLKDKIPKEEHDYVSKMNASVQKMGRMVQGLKDLSRNTSIDSKEDFLFSNIIEDVLVVFADRIKENGVTLSIIGDPLLKVHGHSIQISQVIINLLNNSLDAVKNLGEKWIRIELSVKNSFLQVSVIDSGKGIPNETRAKIMNPFFTTKRPSEGTGLGLSISQKIVEKNNGKLFYDANSSNTKFVLLLPLNVNDE